MRITSNRSRALAALVAAITLPACVSEPEERTQVLRSAASTAHTSIVLRWGAGPEQAGFRPRAREIGAEGPSSVAARGTSIFVLDRLNERVLEVQGAAVRVAAGVPRDAEHLAAGADGSLAAWSPLRARVWLRARGGEPAGELEVPRVLREIRSIELGPSHRLRAATALQDTLDLGSPQAPLDLSSVLRTRREGAAFLSNGHGVAVRRVDRGAELLVYGASERGAKPSIAARHLVEGPFDGVRVVGAAGDVVCLRTEALGTAQAAITVAREAVCLDAVTGSTILRTALPAPGQYTPHEELAVADDPPALVAMTPGDDGLLVQRWSLRGEVSR